MSSRMLLPTVRDIGGDWINQRACTTADLEVFFPTRGQSVASAKAICAECPVQGECLKYALANTEVWGIWGGTSEADRRRLRRGRERPPVISHGTEAGYRAHHRNGEEACVPCKQGHSAAVARRRAA